MSIDPVTVAAAVVLVIYAWLFTDTLADYRKDRR